MAGTDELHGSALAGGGLNADKTGGDKLADMHGDGAVCQPERFRKIIHADVRGRIDNLHNFHAHRGAQRADRFLRFLQRRQIQHNDLISGQTAFFF